MEQKAVSAFYKDFKTGGTLYGAAARNALYKIKAPKRVRGFDLEKAKLRGGVWVPDIGMWEKLMPGGGWKYYVWINGATIVKMSKRRLQPLAGRMSGPVITGAPDSIGLPSNAPTVDDNTRAQEVRRIVANWREKNK